MSDRRYEFTWDIIGDLKEGRPNLGESVNLVLYRLMQYTFRDVLEQRYGTEECDKIFYESGRLAGMYFFEQYMKPHASLPLNGFVAELQRTMKELGIGILRIEKADTDQGAFILTVSEDLDCSGLPDIGIEVCNYDEGFIAGIFYKYTGDDYAAREVDCWCTGDRTCRFEVNRL